MNSLSQRAEMLFERYEKHISSFALVFGFIFDSLTLQRIDLLFENIVIASYLIISGGSIALLNYYEEHPTERVFLVKVKNLLPLFIQFAFGGLFSAFFIFYTRGASFSSSWPFILILLFLLVGNEFFRKYYQRLTFQVSIYFVAIFSFFIFFIPVILKTMGALIFVLSGLVSLLFIHLFSKILLKVVPNLYLESKNDLRNAVLSIFIIINILYFTNLIPPIPLALKEVGVYNLVSKEGDQYVLIGEEERWYEKLNILSAKVARVSDAGSLYVFSSVFAPTDLDTTIVHNWQYFDEEKNKWVSATKIPFSIKGGRKHGYRGFSKKGNLFEGKWRVDVETERGQIIGRVRFDVETRPRNRLLKQIL